MMFDLLGFAAHLARLGANMAVANHQALDRAARIVQREAQSSLGTYQNQAGPFAGWAELADYTKDDRVRHGFSENDPGLRTGTMRNSIGRVVHGDSAEVGSNAKELEWFELGTKHQPPRSVLGGAAVRSGPKIEQAIGDRVEMHLTGRDVAGGSIKAY